MESKTRKKGDICGDIIDIILEREGSDPLDIPPLYDSIDPDALNNLFATAMGGTERSGWIKFRYAGYWVLVEFDGEPTVKIEESSTSK